MLAKSLKESSFFQLLVSRETSEINAKAYTGLLLLTEPEAGEALKFITDVFPGFTSHDMGHSLRILENLYQALSVPLCEELSTSEIFCLIMAAMFHDMGMAQVDVPDAPHQQDRHHLYAKVPLELFMREKMTAIKEWRRLYQCILFVCESHGMDLETFYGHKNFYITDTIDGKPVRFGLLGVLLRIGDLLDLDENRTSDFIRKLYPSRFQDETSQCHHLRHEHIARFSITPKMIDISVLAANAEEYHIWDRWLHYLKEDILHANTYLMPKLGNGMNLPELRMEIGKAEGASFETEELRFELAEEGQIWNILSQSVYTEEFDFIRELVQNGIDAVLMKEYQDAGLELTRPSPRSWGTWERDQRVVAAYSEANRLLLIWDTGIGMDPNQIRRFLFRIADSGHHYQPRTRDFPLYTIAKFGIGFISCLSKCEEIVLYTYPAARKVGCRVRMYSNSTHAYFEELEPQPDSGTTVCMKLKRCYRTWEVRDYLTKTFRYPSVPVEWLDLDQMGRQIEGLTSMKWLKHQLAIGSCGQMPQHLFERDYDYFEAVRNGIFKERYEEKELVKHLSDELEQCWERWVRQEKLDLLKRKSFEREASILLRDIKPLDKYTDIREKISELLTQSKQWNEQEFSNMVSTLLYQIRDQLDGLAVLEQKLEKAANDYMGPRYRLGQASLSPFWEFNECIIPFVEDFSAWTVITEEAQGKRYQNGSGIFFVQCAFDDWNLGVEWRSIHGFLFKNGELTTQLVKIGSEERKVVEETYGVDLEEALDPAFVDDYEPEELLRDYMQSERLVQEIVTSLYQLDVSRCHITWREKTWTECLGTYDGRYLNKRPEKEEHNGDFMEKTIHTLQLTKGINAEVAAIESSIRTKSGMYQDGMPLDVDPTGLVPLGLCRVRVNLTGSAQMDLNVTRRHVDESRTKLDAWIANVGVFIQQRVIELLDQAIRKWGFCVNLSTLYTKEESSNGYFDRHSQELLLGHSINDHIASHANGNN